MKKKPDASNTAALFYILFIVYLVLAGIDLFNGEPFWLLIERGVIYLGAGVAIQHLYTIKNRLSNDQN